MYNAADGSDQKLVSDATDLYFCAGETVYYIKNPIENEDYWYYGDINESLITGDLWAVSGKEAEHLADDVDAALFMSVGGGAAYLKDVERGKATLCYYENGKEYVLAEGVTGLNSPEGFVFLEWMY